MSRNLIWVALIVFGCAKGRVLGRGESVNDSSEADTVRIVAYNIHHGEGMDEVIDLNRIAQLISDLRPDLVALQEVDRGVRRTNIVDQAQSLADLTGLTAHFGEFMPYQGGEYGMAVLTRWQTVTVMNHRLPDGEEPRSALTVRVRSPQTGRELDFVGIHLYRTQDERLAQANSLVEILSNLETPSVLAGDFNSRPNSPVLRLLRRHWRFVEKGEDRFTFPSDAPDREIDFFAYRPNDAFEVRRQLVLHEAIASDHRPLFVELVWQ